MINAAGIEKLVSQPRTITKEQLVDTLAAKHPNKNRATISFLVDLHKSFRDIVEREVRAYEAPRQDVVIPIHEVNGPRGEV